jgi:hypothetical protein
MLGSAASDCFAAKPDSIMVVTNRTHKIERSGTGLNEPANLRELSLVPASVCGWVRRLICDDGGRRSPLLTRGYMLKGEKSLLKCKKGRLSRRSVLPFSDFGSILLGGAVALARFISRYRH